MSLPPRAGTTCCTVPPGRGGTVIAQNAPEKNVPLVTVYLYCKGQVWVLLLRVSGDRYSREWGTPSYVLGGLRGARVGGGEGKLGVVLPLHIRQSSCTRSTARIPAFAGLRAKPRPATAESGA